MTDYRTIHPSVDELVDLKTDENQLQTNYSY